MKNKDILKSDFDKVLEVLRDVNIPHTWNESMGFDNLPLETGYYRLTIGQAEIGFKKEDRSFVSITKPIGEKYIDCSPRINAKNCGEERKALEHDIIKLINNFEEKHQVRVTGLDLERAKDYHERLNTIPGIFNIKIKGEI